jgi:TRAP-type mannitol/chloroaromatic compound transport system permease large subunit
MQTTGLWMILVLGILVLTSGIPVWALLVGVSTIFAMLGMATGAVDLPVLAALPSRVVGLLEHDLLQAMALYAFVGMLLQRVAVADAIFDTLSHLVRPLVRRTPTADALAGLGVGTLLAPMNGSVASSSVLLGRLAGLRLQTQPAAPATALISVAATIGVVVPPSLVLIFLGDAMLRAHTEASNLPGYAQVGQRIVNTQDILHATLPPALLLLVLWLGVAWWQTRDATGNDSIAPHSPYTNPLRTARPGSRVSL